MVMMMVMRQDFVYYSDDFEKRIKLSRKKLLKNDVLQVLILSKNVVLSLVKNNTLSRWSYDFTGRQ